MRLEEGVGGQPLVVFLTCSQTVYHRWMLSTVRIVATSVFGVITFVVGSFVSANIRKLASERGWNNLLVHGWDRLPQKWRDELRWERLRALW